MFQVQSTTVVSSFEPVERFSQRALAYYVSPSSSVHWYAFAMEVLAHFEWRLLCHQWFCLLLVACHKCFDVRTLCYLLLAPSIAGAWPGRGGHNFRSWHLCLHQSEFFVHYPYIPVRLQRSPVCFWLHSAQSKSWMAQHGFHQRSTVWSGCCAGTSLVQLHLPDLQHLLLFPQLLLWLHCQSCNWSLLQSKGDISTSDHPTLVAVGSTIPALPLTIDHSVDHRWQQHQASIHRWQYQTMMSLAGSILTLNFCSRRSWWSHNSTPAWPDFPAVINLTNGPATTICDTLALLSWTAIMS